MTYDETRETFRFVWRNERFVLARCWQEAKYHGRSPVLVESARPEERMGSCSDSGMAPQAIENTQNGLGKGKPPRRFGGRIDDYLCAILSSASRPSRGSGHDRAAARTSAR
jgi:hypothetical protein